MRAPPRFVERWSWAMGQPVHLMLFHESEAEGLDIAQAVFQELRRVEGHLSRFDDRSDLEELNRRAGRGPMRAGLDLLAVLAAATHFKTASEGAFNVAVEPLMRAWGFRGPRTGEPGAVELKEASAAVRAAVVTIEGDRVSLPSRITQLDFAGIGVGYGLDRAAALLRKRGVARGFLDVSGDCIALGAPPGAPGWRVDLADPNRPGATVPGVLLRDRALATSANTVAVVRYGARVRGHVMNPDTGYPADRMLQASVVARTGLAADALSKAVLIKGSRVPGVERCWLMGGNRAAARG
jgi:thiamine biosynthesis lipoprotein